MSDISSCFEVYIDESNSPVFEPDAEARPYVVCAIAIPSVKKEIIQNLLPRDINGIYLKASSLDLTDDLAALFLENILLHDIFISLVGVDTANGENTDISNKSVDYTNKYRQKPIRKANLMYALIVKEAICNIWWYGKISSFELILDSNSVPKQEFTLFKNTLTRQFKKRSVLISEISRKTEQESPLLFAADIIAGVIKRMGSHKDLPKCSEQISKGLEQGKIFFKNGFDVYYADEQCRGLMK